MTNLKLQKKLAAKMAKVGLNRVKINPKASEDVKEAITKADIGAMISEGKIEIKNKRGVSRYRARNTTSQRKKGRRKGLGRRKGSRGARSPAKRAWINKIRLQRKTLSELKNSGKIAVDTYRRLYRKANSGFFRSKKHLIMYINKEKTKRGEN